MTALVVTRAGVEEAEWVLALRDAVSQWMLDTGIEQWRPGEFPLAYLRASFRRGEVYVATCDGTRVGSVTIEWDDRFIWGPQAEPAGYVHRLMIDRGHTGRGRGRQLLQFAEQRIADSGRAIVRLDCVRSNQPLRDYYERAGYRLVGYKDFPDLPGIPETALYEKDVDPGRSRSS